MTVDATTAFARALVDEWVRCGVRHAVVAPGSRSTPLALALAERSELTLSVVIDERSAAFRALGIGKATGVPAVLLCTSGTAAAHFAPAVIEADAARVPMIVCTADRPPELHDVGAAQTIDQQHLYGNAVRWFVDPGVPTDLPDANAVWRTLACRLFTTARGDATRPAGPVHCNLAFREPLVPTGAPLVPTPGRADGAPWVTTVANDIAVDAASVDAVVASVRAHVRGVVLAGWGAWTTPETMRRFARASGWPLLADPISNVRTGEHAIGTYEALLRAPGFADAHTPTIALRVGAPLTSKVTNQWCDARMPQVLLDPFDAWLDPQRAAMTRITATPDAVLAAAADVLEAAPCVDQAERDAWFQQWRDADHLARTAITKLLESWDDPFDGRVAHDLVGGLPDGVALFVASSMPVRDLEWFAGARTGIHMYASRGTNGIDGFASTAMGLADGDDIPVIAIGGDLAFLHDINGLLGADARASRTVCFVVLDNNGGGIFSFLPQAELPTHFETLWGTPHNRDLAAIARAYGANVCEVATADGVLPAVEDALAAGGCNVVVVRTDRAKNVERHRQVWDVVADALNGGQ
ncbi:MAG: 2-succinyl-5-enolpyruvyl-6-hydroxy-3-cyclohexene-1-carboxylic-acid synthase [Acidimicrobiia bacterium]